MARATKSRRYALGKRAEAQKENREAILRAARALVAQRGAHAVSLDDVAERAGLGRTTIFEQFGSKKGLLTALEDDATQRAGGETLFAALSSGDAVRAIEAILTDGLAIWGRERAVFRRLFGDPALRDVWREKEK